MKLADLEAAHFRYPRRHGSPTITRYLRLLGDGARSEAERIVATLFHESGTVGWTPNTSAEGYVIDVAFTREKLAVEIDGFAHHRDVTTFQRDRTKRNALIAVGWTVLNFTWADIVERGDQVVTTVRDALSRSVA